MAVISAYQLSKLYGNKTALSEFNIQIASGEIFGLLGSAGSGKTTFLRILAGIVDQTEGKCSILGLSPKSDFAKLHAMMGIATETAALYPEMTLERNLRFFANLHNVNEDDAIDRISFLLHTLDIWEYREYKAKSLPTNAAQRAHIARALIHSPQVLLLDEPTAAMDRETTESVKNIIDHITYQEGVTSLICTRYPEQAEKICTRFGVINDAALLTKGTMKELMLSSGIPYVAQIKISENSPAPANFVNTDGVWQKNITNENDMPQIISSAVSQGCRIYEASVVKPTLAEICDAFVTGKYLETEEESENAEFSEPNNENAEEQFHWEEA